MENFLLVKRNSVTSSWYIDCLGCKDKYGVVIYANTPTYVFNTHHSIPTSLLDITEDFYLRLYPTLCDLWYTDSTTVRPIEYWIHQYVKYGVATNLSFYEYYSKALQLYNSLHLDSNTLIAYIIYNSQWQKI